MGELPEQHPETPPRENLGSEVAQPRPGVVARKVGLYLFTVVDDELVEALNSPRSSPECAW
jgi:hypothetical protein